MLSKERSLRSEFIRYITPSILAQWVYSLYAAVDGLFVSRGVSTTAMTAVNVSSPFIAFLFATSLLFAVGTSTVVAISLGEGKTKKANEVFSQNFVFLIILSLLVTILVLWRLTDFAYFLGATEETLPFVKTYIGTLTPFAMMFILSYSFEILLKTDGHPKKATVIVSTGVIANCILDYLLIIVWKWGIFGAAFATGMSQAFIIILYLSHFLSKEANLHFARFRWDVHVIWRSFKNGLASGVTELSAGIAVFLFNHAIIAYLGQDALVSYTIINYVSAIYIYSMTGIAQGAQPLISYSYGAGDRDIVGRLLKYCIVATTGLMILAFTLVELGAPALAALFIPKDAALQAQAVQSIRIYSLSFIPVGYTIVFAGYFASIEHAGRAVAATVARAAIVLAPVLFLMIRLFGGGGIWWAPLVSEVACLVIAVVLYRGTIRR